MSLNTQILMQSLFTAHTHKHIFTANWQQVLLQSVLEQYRNHLPTRFNLIQLAYHLHWLIHKNMTHNIISEWVSSCQIKSLTDKLMLNRCLGIVSHRILCKLEVGVRKNRAEKERERQWQRKRNQNQVRDGLRSFFLPSAVCLAVVRVNDNGGCDILPHAETVKLACMQWESKMHLANLCFSCAPVSSHCSLYKYARKINIHVRVFI